MPLTDSELLELVWSTSKDEDEDKNPYNAPQQQALTLEKLGSNEDNHTDQAILV